MDKQIRRIGILTSGGDAPGMNALIRSVVRTASAYDISVLGIRRGYSGLINGDIIEMGARSVDGIIRRGGTMLYTARCKEMMTEEGLQMAADTCKYLGIDGLICCGGDGTLNEVVTGLLQLEHPPVLGYLPAGTTNDFSKNLHLPGRILAAADCAVSGIPRPCDLGRFNDRNFVYVAAFGVFSEVSYATPQDQKKRLGHLAYVLQCAQQLGKIES